MMALVVAVAVINILLGVAVTRWSFTMKRHREAELIWRGGRYARALDCYAQARGAPPTRLEQLVEERCIRRLYEDPMSESGEWRVLRVADLLEEQEAAATGDEPGGSPSVPSGKVVSASGRSLRDRMERSFSLRRERSPRQLSSDRSGLPDRASLRDRVREDRGPDSEPARGWGGRPSENDEMDGIVGVVSTSDEESFRPWRGGHRYSDWRFMVGTSRVEVPRLPGLSVPSAGESPDGQTEEGAVPAGSESGSGLRERVRRSSGGGGR